MASSISQVFRTIYREEYSEGILDFEEICSNAVKKALGKTEEETGSFLNRHLNNYWIKFVNQMLEDQNRGIRPIFEVKDYGAKKVTWQTCSDRKKKLDDILIYSRPSILNAMDKLTDREYEALACLVSKVLGAENVFLTPAGNEGGIDFIATIKFPQNAHYFFGVNGPIRIIGQCKKYSSKVQSDKIKEFIQTLEQVKNQNPRVERVIPSWFRLSKGLIIGWVISQEGFQSGSESLAKDHGIVLSDSRDLAEILSMSRRFFPNESPAERARAVKNAVVKILSDDYDVLT